MSRIRAIKRVREATNMGLHDAKNLVEGVERDLAEHHQSPPSNPTTLRDQFAMAALTALVHLDGPGFRSTLAGEAYAYADSMMQARDQ